MSTADSVWETRAAELWKAIDTHEPDDFVACINALVSELPINSAIGLFEQGAAQDSTGHPDLAVPLYRAALKAGLTGLRRRRATIQMASSLRSLGETGSAADLLTSELAAPSDELDGAVRAFLALALADLGREREAVAVALTALSRYLPRYNQSLARYAEALSRSTTASTPSDAVNFAEKLAKFSEHWSPRVVAAMNDYEFKLVKLQGEFVWHTHKDTDESFIVLTGEMEIGFRDRTVTVRAGEMFVVPKGVEHITRAARECHALIIEPSGVVNTGEAGGALTALNDVWV